MTIRKNKRHARRAVKRPARHAYPIDATWKAVVRGIMAERGLSQAKLAALIGASPPAVVLLFKPHTERSTLVPAIHQAFGLVPPVAPGATQAIRAA